MDKLQTYIRDNNNKQQNPSKIYTPRPNNRNGMLQRLLQRLEPVDTNKFTKSYYHRKREKSILRLVEFAQIKQAA
jgi:hypothetical protein